MTGLKSTPSIQVGFLDLADSLAKNALSDNEVEKLAMRFETAYESHHVSERLGGFTRLYSALCYSTAGDYHFKKVLDDLRALGETSHLLIDEILAPTLSRDVMQALVDFCDEDFVHAEKHASDVLGFISKLGDNEELRNSYLKFKSEDELDYLIDLLSICKEGSEWLVGLDVPRCKPEEFLTTFSRDLTEIRGDLQSAEIAPWTRWLAYLFYGLVQKQVESKSFHTFFHKHGLDCSDVRGLTTAGLSVCFQPQTDACDRILSGEDVLLTSATGTGKTSLGIMAIASKRKSGGLLVYAAPTRTLAYQVGNNISRTAYRDNPAAVKVFTREEEVTESSLVGTKVLVGTYEKVDGIMRQGLVRKNQIELLVVDECHSISNLNRGVSLDFFLTRFRSTNPTQRLFLSAVIPEEDTAKFARWAKIHQALSYEKPWRRTELHELVHYNGQNMASNEFLDSYDKLGYLKQERGRIDPVLQETIRLFKDDKIVLVIVESRRTAESFAARLVTELRTRAYYSLANDKEIAERLERAKTNNAGHVRKIGELELVTPQLHSQVINLIENSITFHHAGIPNDVRTIIEDLIETKMVRVIVATTTLEMGVNFPVDSVLVRRLLPIEQVKPVRKAMKDNQFLQYAYGRYIDASRTAYLNTIGRAGRAGYAETGESIFFIQNEDDAESFRDLRLRSEAHLAAGGDLYFLSRIKLTDEEQWKLPQRVRSALDESRGRFLSSLLSIIATSNGTFDSIMLSVKDTWLWFKLSEILNSEQLVRAESLLKDELEYVVDKQLARQHPQYSLTPFGKSLCNALIYPTSVMRMLVALSMVHGDL